MRRRNRNRREARECGEEVEASTDSSGTGDEWHVRLGGIKERKRRNKEVMDKRKMVWLNAVVELEDVYGKKDMVEEEEEDDEEEDDEEEKEDDEEEDDEEEDDWKPDEDDDMEEEVQEEEEEVVEEVVVVVKEDVEEQGRIKGTLWSLEQAGGGERTREP